MPHLKDVDVRNAKPTTKPYKIADGDGLHLEVTPAGGKLWRLKYRYRGRSLTLALGRWPEIGLKDARRRSLEARTLLANGIDPADDRRREKNAATFAVLCEQWLAMKMAGGAPAPKTVEKWVFLTGHLTRRLGTLKVEQVTRTDVKEAVRAINAQTGRETAARAFSTCARIFAFAVDEGFASHNVAADVNREHLIPARNTKHHAALTDPVAVGGLLRAIDGYQGAPATRLALRFAALTFVRPGTLRHAEWAEIDGDLWRVPAAKMKCGEAFLVPLCRQALAVLDELRPLTGDSRYLFPCERTRARPMSENTINGALRRLGFAADEMTGHGFRSMASTLLHELGFAPMVIERQLAHAERNQVASAYNRSTLLPERTRMMAAWGDYLDGLRAGGNVAPLRRVVA